MFEIINKTPFQVALVPGIDHQGHEKAVVVIKGTFELRPNADLLPLSEEQVPIKLSDEFYGGPGVSSIRYESDTCLPKKGGDVVLMGHGYPKRSNDLQADVAVSVGSLKKTVRVVGDRIWEKTLVGWRASDPVPFERIPLMYERSFGGRDVTSENPAEHAYEPRNPVGRGFTATDPRKRPDGLALPNLEDPGEPVKSWKERPAPAGFGFIGRDWMPRSVLAGTYDEKWQSDRCPLLPADFDPRYFNAASAGLVAPAPFNGGEAVRVAGAHRSGDLAFRLPKRRLAVTAWIKDQPRQATPAMDTVLIEPDEGRLVLVWRAAIPCTREFLYIRSVFIKEAGG